MNDTPKPMQRSGTTRPELNPFPSAGVARLVLPGAEFWSIETEALKQARNHLLNYLRRATQEQQQPERSDSQGHVLAIVGDYGTGKTHIAQDMLYQIAAEENSHLHPLYLDAPSDSFMALYRNRFMKELNRNEVLQRVDDYYADIVADELDSSELTKRVAQTLRQRTISADEVVKNFGLMESKFERELYKKLKDVTEQSDFATALLLLRRPEFKAAVWEWLKGNPPDKILQEREITRQIANDADALEAIGVMAFLFGQQGHRFILFIDEIEKILSFTAENQPSEATILALKKLMEVMSLTRALLVLIGLPEFKEFLPEDARQRITSIVHPSALTVNEIEQYIREAKRRATDTDSIDPFTMDAIYYLAEIAGGNARKVVRLCHHAYSAAGVAGSNVTPSMLREITREQFELSTDEDVIAEITRSIESHGWLFEKEKTLDLDGSEQRVNLWLPVGEKGAGVALLVTSSILLEAEAQALAERTEAMTKENATKARIETVLVINGYVSDNLRPELERSFGKVILYRLRTFRQNLDSALTDVRTRLEQQDREDLLSAIKQRVDEITRQNNTIDDHLSEVLRRAFGRGELQAAVSTGLRNVFGQLASNTSLSETNYPRVAAVFDEALRAIDDIHGLDATLDLIIGLPQWIVHNMDLERYSYSRRHASQDSLLEAYNSLRGPGYLLLVRAACLAFRRGVFTCLNEYPVATDEFPFDVITEMCQAFDSLSERVDLRDLVEEVNSLNRHVVAELGLDEYLEGTKTAWRAPSRSAAMKATDTVRQLGDGVYWAVRDEIRR